MARKWFESVGEEEDVVVSTRIRLARNLEDYRFPEKISIEDADSMMDKIMGVIKGNLKGNYDYFKITDLDRVERKGFIENHIISPTLLRYPNKSGFFLRDDETVNIMVNEEDHIRIQALLPGLNFEKGYAIVDRIDDSLEKDLRYAFDENYGYLTSCPTNLGTGLRASAMVHIPALSMSGHLKGMMQGFSKIGLVVRGIYGEGTEALGYFYQISNQITMGETEKELMDKLKRVVYQVVDKEREVRRFLLEYRYTEMEDRIYRSLGILKNARLLSSREAMSHISNIRMGMDFKIVENIDYRDITQLIILSQPANIQLKFGKGLEKYERDVKRADLVREYFQYGEV